LGTRAFGIYPRKFESYSIYGATVYSPGNGVILRCADGLPDLAPGQTDRTNGAGNHVVIRLDEPDANLLLAHLKNGSVLVKVGDRVSAGQPIGQVGNSGNNSEPHLHLQVQKQVTKDGKSERVPVPIRFGSRWLARNSLVIA
jgi:murein DD-endopeptidase MepM/ murein hydrolase activator NlpD